uniref:Uncharacterized protein n=1 Tax=Anguilla anguilla TaxID=7936 RepID=A0A0E9VZ86_ANGAN
MNICFCLGLSFLSSLLLHGYDGGSQVLVAL